MSNVNVYVGLKLEHQLVVRVIHQSLGLKTNNQLLVRLAEFIGVVSVAIDGLPFLTFGKSQACKLIVT